MNAHRSRRQGFTRRLALMLAPSPHTKVFLTGSSQPLWGVQRKSTNPQNGR
jgi:hypothetical protein